MVLSLSNSQKFGTSGIEGVNSYVKTASCCSSCLSSLLFTSACHGRCCYNGAVCCRNADVTKKLEASHQMIVKKQLEIDQLQNEVAR